MANIRFKGGNASERLDLTTVKQGDMIQARHDPNGAEDSDKGIPFGLCQATPVFECTTAGATASKVASLISDETFPDFVLYNGRQIMVHFTHGNAVDSPTLNVGGVAYPIRLQNQKSTVVIGEGCWGDDVWLSFMFVSDGTNSYWILLGHNIAKQRSDATSGYTIYADGKIKQWGKYITSQYGAVTVPFNIPFPDTNFIVFTTNSNTADTAPAVLYNMSAINISTNSFTTRHDSGIIFWIALN